MPANSDVPPVPPAPEGPQAPAPLPERHEASGQQWPIVLSGVAVVGLLVGMLVLMPLFGRPDYEVGLYDTHPAGAVVTMRGLPAAFGERAHVPDARMLAVGRTDQGYLVYVDVQRDVGGGGGGPPERYSDLSTHPEVWVRVAPNTYRRVARNGALQR